MSAVHNPHRIIATPHFRKHSFDFHGAKMLMIPSRSKLSSLRTVASTPTAPTSFKHPRQIGWPSTVALAMGGSNQCLFLLTALFAGQGDILGQGSATVPLLLLGLLLSYAAAPGW